MTSVEEDLNERRPKRKTTSMESDIGRRRTQCSTAYKPINLAKLGTAQRTFTNSQTCAFPPPCLLTRNKNKVLSM